MTCCGAFVPGFAPEKIHHIAKFAVKRTAPGGLNRKAWSNLAAATGQTAGWARSLRSGFSSLLDDPGLALPASPPGATASVFSPSPRTTKSQPASGRPQGLKWGRAPRPRRFCPGDLASRTRASKPDPLDVHGRYQDQLGPLPIFFGEASGVEIDQTQFPFRRQQGGHRYQPQAAG